MTATQLDRGKRNALLRRALEARRSQKQASSAAADAAMTSAQERLWFLERFTPGTPLFNITRAFELRGALDADRLEQALDRLIARHEALRTGFRTVDGQPLPFVVPSASFALERRDLTELASAARSVALEEIEAELARRPFDLEAPPLLRSLLVRVEEDHYRWLLSLHHLVFDGWSLDVLLRQLGTLWESLGAPPRGGSEAAGLAPEAVPFSDYQRWQADGGLRDADGAYWRDLLAGPLPVLDLATDHRRPEVASLAGDGLHFRLPTAELRQLAQRAGVSLFSVLLSGWALTLGRLAQQGRVVVGTPVANRLRQETEDTIGLFVNTLPLVLDVTGEGTVLDLLQRVHERLLEGLAHQGYPFARMVEDAAPGRRLGYTPFFQNLFSFQNAQGEALKLSGVEVDGPRVVEKGAVELDLMMTLEERPDGAVDGRFGYRTELFTEATATSFLDAYRQVLAAMAAAPDGLPARIPLVPPEAVVVPVAGDWPRDVSLYDLFVTQAAVQPQKVALSWALGDGDESLTYGELAERVEGLAAHLQSLGVGPDVAVAVALPRSGDLVVALLAVMAAGGAYVPLDPSYPRTRLEHMLDDSGADLVISEAGVLPRELVADRQVVTVAAGDEHEGNLSPVLGADSRLAYIIYTSGSTGRPKGVASSHRGAVSLLRWARRELADEVPDGVAAVTSVCFDLSVFELFFPLAWGGSVVLLENPLALGRLPSGLASRIRWLNTVPSVAAEWLRQEAIPPTVQRLSLAGEPLRRSLADGLYDLPGVTEVYNLYGPSEDTTYSTGVLVPRREATEPSLGTAITETGAYVTDDRLELLPQGAAGELCLAGAGLARGYHGQPARTAESFRPDPWSGEPGGRVYRTGDRVRRRADGELEFLGRFDHQVKVRGLRIELGEIETALEAHPAVRAAAAGVEGVAEDAVLRTWYVADGEPLSDDELRTFLGRKLPQFMVPTSFRRLDELPRSPNGKLDRAALPVGQDDDLPTAPPVAPRNRLEAVVAACWGEVLERSSVSVREDFFALGGHSLKAVRVLSRIYQELGVELPLRTLFEAPTVERLAAHLASVGALPEGGGEIPRRAAEQPPASYAQRRLWFIDRLEPGAVAFNLPVAFRLRGELDDGALSAALEDLTRRHEVLRSHFAVDGGEPVQVISPPSPVALRRVVAEGDDGLREQAVEEAAVAFELTTGPLFRAVLVELGDDDHGLLLTLHHSVGDGVSLDILFGDLAAFYDARRSGLEADLEPLSVQYGDYAEWQRARLSAAAMAEHVDWWRENLAGLPPVLDLPTDRPRPATQSYRGGLVRRVLPESAANALRQLARQHGVSLFMVLLTAYQELLRRYCGVEDLVTGTAMDSRRRRQLEPLIGLFLDILVVRGDFRRRPTFGEALERLRQAVLAAQEHAEVPFEKLVEELVPERSLAYAPLVQAVYAFVEKGRRRLALEGLEVSPVEVPQETSKSDLSLQATELDDGLELLVGYRADLFDRSTAERLAGHLAHLLTALPANARRPLEHTPWMDETERAEVLAAWRGPERRRPPFRSVAAEILSRAEERAEQTAVEDDGGRLSYGDLAQRARALAARLRKGRGAEETPIAVLLDSDTAGVVASLAVWLAGAPLLRLDPDYPDERLQMLLAEAGVEQVITRGELTSRLPAGLEAVLLAGAAPAAGALTAVEAEALAYVVFTSGSTGTPKGVEVSHGALARHCLEMIEKLELTPVDRVLQFAAPVFDVAFEQLLPPLMAGATVVLRGHRLWTTDELRRRLTNLTVVDLPSAYWQQLVRDAQGAVGGDQAADWGSLRLVLVGGDVFPASSVGEWHQVGPPAVRVLNAYGPTEATITATIHDLDGARDGQRPRVPIGRPLGNREVRILDDRGEPVPWGVPGELLLGGEGLARGYRGDPRKTAAAFVPDPFASEPGGRLYRSGDRARFLADGAIDFLGRRDHQVKVRGFRIELGEVEAALLAHPAVREAVVTAPLEERSQERMLAAYLVGEVDDGEMRDHLAERLPPYMRPAALVHLDALPKTPNGVILRSALPAISAEEAADDEYLAPRTASEELLAGLWAEILDRRRIGVEDNFFDIGGHSLDATRLIHRLEEVSGIVLEVTDIFFAQTVEELAEVFEEALLEAVEDGSGGEAEESDESLLTEGAWQEGAMRHSDATEESLPEELRRAFDGRLRRALERSAYEEAIPRRDEIGPAPLSWSQEILWFVENQGTNPPSIYRFYPTLGLTGALDRAALAETFKALGRRHDILHTRFAANAEGHSFQEVVADFELHPLEVDLTALPEERRAPEAARRIGIESNHAFDLSRPSMMRPVLFRHHETLHWLLLSVHHIIVDDWAFGVLFRELSALYEAFCLRRRSALPELSIQYADYALWERQRLTGDYFERLQAYWHGRFADGLPQIRLRTDRPRPALPSYRGSYSEAVLPAELVSALRQRSREEDASLFMALLAAFKLVLSSRSGQRDVMVACANANRPRQEAEALLGSFFNLMLLRTELTGDPTLRQLLGRVKETALGAYAHQEFPFILVAPGYQPEGLPPGKPPIQALFTFQNAPPGGVALHGLEVESVHVDSHVATDLDLLLSIKDAGDELYVGLVYDSDVFTAETLDEMQAEYRAYLEAMVASPDAPLSELGEAFE
ncbi:MAG: amino acid adenylation domain-containing protein [Acidobacteriota bacterium]